MKFPKVALIFVITVVVVGSAIFLHETRPQSNPASYNKLDKSNLIFNEVYSKMPNANWSMPASTSQQTFYGYAEGQQIRGEITSNKAMVDHFENTDTLKSLGYVKDLNLEADSPGSSNWGYKKTINGSTHILIFSYNTIPTSMRTGEPVQFDCPCKVILKVFAGYTSIKQ